MACQRQKLPCRRERLLQKHGFHYFRRACKDTILGCWTFQGRISRLAWRWRPLEGVRVLLWRSTGKQQGPKTTITWASNTMMDTERGWWDCFCLRHVSLGECLIHGFSSSFNSHWGAMWFRLKVDKGKHGTSAHVQGPALLPFWNVYGSRSWRACGLDGLVENWFFQLKFTWPKW